MFIIPFLIAAAINSTTAQNSMTVVSDTKIHRMGLQDCASKNLVRMRAYYTAGSTFVFWLSCGEDPTGVASNYGPTQLTDIVRVR